MDEISLRAYLTFMSEHYAKQQLDLYGFLLTHGTYMTGQRRPKGFRKQRDKMCYRNAQRMAVIHRDKYTYCEGIGVSTIPCQHGWLVDTDGNVIDPTWRTPETATYIGVKVKTEYLAQFVVKHKLWTSVLGCHTHPCDLLTGVTPVEQALLL